jgi:hypothetical protein
MPEFKDGKIYVIKSQETENVYIGSTCSPLLKRMSCHKSAFKTNAIKMGSAKHILKYADAYIELVENFPCETRRALLDREGEITKNNPNCINTVIQGRTITEYRAEHKDKLKLQRKNYDIKNKESVQAKKKIWYDGPGGRALLERLKITRKVKIPCATCNKEINKGNMARHINLKH